MEHAAETVVLLHGIGRMPGSMAGLEKQLKAAGFQTLNLGYPWRDMDIAGLASFVANTLATKDWGKVTRLHFVTHSMGGLVAAYLLGKLRDRLTVTVGYVVMLGPPLGGSEVADALSSFAPYQWLYGPAGQDLTTKSGLLDGITPDYPLGIIAGTMGWPYMSGLFIRGLHDGRVSVARTRFAGMTDHLILPVMHSFMATDSRVHKQVLHFMQTGAFSRS